jgi:hypothetical protein
MNKKNKMKDQILKHAFKLQSIFNLPEGFDSKGHLICLQITKALHRLEVKAHQLAEDYCNGKYQTEDFEKIDAKIENALDKILNFRAKKIPCFYNFDPRGYALKIESEYIAKNNIEIERDWGGYGILAPEFDGNN